MGMRVFVFFCLLICLLQACTPNVYPGLRPFPLAPRVIQPMEDRRGNENVLPPDPNFVQSYTKFKKSKTDSRFGALVRVVEFEYDISDTISIIPRLTSGYDEGQMTGWFTIMLDQYELTYENTQPQIRDYVEEISFESSDKIDENRFLYDPIGAAAVNSTQKNQTSVVNRSQLYNSAKYVLEPEDARLIERSKTLYFVIHLQNCTLSVFPSKEQVKVIKRMISKYYFNERI